MDFNPIPNTFAVQCKIVEFVACRTAVSTKFLLPLTVKSTWSVDAVMNGHVADVRSFSAFIDV